MFGFRTESHSLNIELNFSFSFEINVVFQLRVLIIDIGGEGVQGQGMLLSEN